MLRNPNDNILDEVAEGVRKGKVLIYHTETCYGIGTNALKEDSVRKIYDIKERSKSKKLSCIVHSLEDAEKYSKLSKKERKICKEFMPGPLTLVSEKKDKIPDILNDKFVFRISSNKIADKLAEKSGTPIVSTSANLSGAPNPYSIKDISRLVKKNVDYIIDVGELDKVKPSTVLELQQGEIKIWRKGPVSKEDLEDF